jgi:ATP-dependent Clp protease ATP-binding subunit ClpB
VVLFDEIEKAHPDVFNTLLQVLDDGRLTDGQGRTVDFKNTVVILTSNLGSVELSAIEERRDLSDEDKQRRLDEVALGALQEALRPEFINRLDETIVFRRLDRTQIRSIVEVQLKRLESRLRDRDLSLTVTTQAKDAIAQEGFDPQYGARPLKRAIQRLVENPLAQLVLGGRYRPGETVVIDAVDGKIGFDKSPVTETTPQTTSFGGPRGQA